MFHTEELNGDRAAMPAVVLGTVKWNGDGGPAAPMNGGAAPTTGPAPMTGPAAPMTGPSAPMPTTG